MYKILSHFAIQRRNIPQTKVPKNHMGFRILHLLPASDWLYLLARWWSISRPKYLYIYIFLYKTHNYVRRTNKVWNNFRRHKGMNSISKRAINSRRMQTSYTIKLPRQLSCWRRTLKIHPVLFDMIISYSFNHYVKIEVS
jgi:hypothetical protein